MKNGKAFLQIFKTKNIYLLLFYPKSFDLKDFLSEAFLTNKWTNKEFKTVKHLNLLGNRMRFGKWMWKCEKSDETFVLNIDSGEYEW